MKKTLFITMSDGEVSKSILYSSIFSEIKRHARVVFLVHKNKAEYFRELLKGEAIVEVFPVANSLRLEEWLLDLFLFSVPTASIKVKIEHGYLSGGFLVSKWIKYALWALGHVRLYRSLCRALYAALPDSSLDTLFEQYKPDAVLAANLTALEDARLLKAARKRRVPSVGMPKGWDNLTLKTLIPVFPDQLLVQTPLMKNDARKLDVPEERIVVTGFPKFDVYADRSNLVSREKFMRTLGLDPARKLILYAGAGDVLAPHDEEVLARFLAAIETGEIPGAPQVLVRPHPKYVYRIETVPPRPFWVYDRPGTVVGSRAMDFEFTEKDVIHLMHSLAHADLLIHTASTLGIESSIFDKPSITIGFDGDQQLAHHLSTARYYDYEHYVRVLKTGGMKVAHSFAELCSFTNEYLASPHKDREARAVLVEENAYKVDGSAGARVAEALKSVLQK